MQFAWVKSYGWERVIMFCKSQIHIEYCKVFYSTGNIYTAVILFVCFILHWNKQHLIQGF